MCWQLLLLRTIRLSPVPVVDEVLCRGKAGVLANGSSVVRATQPVITLSRWLALQLRSRNNTYPEQYDHVPRHPFGLCLILLGISGAGLSRLPRERSGRVASPPS